MWESSSELSEESDEDRDESIVWTSTSVSSSASSTSSSSSSSSNCACAESDSVCRIDTTPKSSCACASHSFSSSFSLSSSSKKHDRFQSSGGRDSEDPIINTMRLALGIENRATGHKRSASRDQMHQESLQKKRENRYKREIVEQLTAKASQR